MPRILLIEPDVFSQKLLVHLLGKHGIEVATTRRGSAGLHAARNNAPDLLITDIATEDLNGFEIIRAVRHSKALGAELPIIVLSTLATRATVIRAGQIGANAFLSKIDFNVELFLNKVAGLLGIELHEEGGASAPDERSLDPAMPQAAEPQPRPILDSQGVEVRVHTGEPALHTLPSPEDLSGLLESMVGAKVEVTVAEPRRFDPEAASAVGVYVEDKGAVALVVVADVAVVNNLGAALSLIPKEKAAEFIHERRISGQLRENFVEVMNVLATTFNLPESTRITLKEVLVTPEDSMPGEVMRLIQNPADSVDCRIGVQVQVAGYGAGVLSIFSPGPSHQIDEADSQPAETRASVASGAVAGSEPNEPAAGQAPREPPVESVYPAPSVAALRKFTDGLLGRQVDIDKRDPVQWNLSEPCIAGIYTTDEGSAAVIVITDVALACNCGAALSMIPVEKARAEAKNGVIEGDLRENFDEILNTAVSLLNGPKAPHLSLSRSIVPPTEPLPADALQIVQGRVARADFTVDVSGYGAGVMTFFLT